MSIFILPKAGGTKTAPVTLPETQPETQPVVTPSQPAPHPFERPPGLDPDEAPEPKASTLFFCRF